jgi:hypothetical protein
MGELALASLVLVVGAGVAVSIALTRHPQTTSLRTTDRSASANPTASSLPNADLLAANLAAPRIHVTAFAIKGRGSADGLTLIGAYADPAETILFFSGVKNPNLGQFTVYDDRGWLNSYTRGGQGAPEHQYLGLATGPHVAADGLAHITITDQMPAALSGSQAPIGTRLFSFSLKVAPAVRLPAPAPIQLGSWNVTLEKVQLTPAVIFLQALVSGASPDQIQSSTVTLLDPSGQPVRQLVQGAGITVPKQQLNASNSNLTRLTYQWERPVADGTYQLRISGSGSIHVIDLTVPAT